MITIIVVIAARKTKPPKTPSAIMPPILSFVVAPFDFIFDRLAIVSEISLSRSLSVWVKCGLDRVLVVSVGLTVFRVYCGDDCDDGGTPVVLMGGCDDGEYELEGGDDGGDSVGDDDGLLLAIPFPPLKPEPLVTAVSRVYMLVRVVGGRTVDDVVMVSKSFGYELDGLDGGRLLPLLVYTDGGYRGEICDG